MSDRTWPPLEVDYPPESTVKVVTGQPRPQVVEDEPEPELTPTRRARQLKVGILKAANDHIDEAVAELNAAIGWYEIVAGDDDAHNDLLRQVEGLAETMAYRLKIARER